MLLLLLVGVVLAVDSIGRTVRREKTGGGARFCGWVGGGGGAAAVITVSPPRTTTSTTAQVPARRVIRWATNTKNNSSML